MKLVSLQIYSVPVSRCLPFQCEDKPQLLSPWGPDKPSRILLGCWRLLRQPSCFFWGELLVGRTQSLLSAGLSESLRIICPLGMRLGNGKVEGGVGKRGASLLPQTPGSVGGRHLVP